MSDYEVRSRDWHAQARLDLYERMLDVRDLSGALRCLQDLAKLDGIYDQKPTIEVDGETWYSTRGDLARSLGVSIRTVSRYVADGRVERREFDGQPRYRMVEITRKVEPARTREEGVNQLAEIASGILSGQIDPRVGNAAATALKTAVASEGLPRGEVEQSIEDLAAELPSDPLELAKLATKYLQ